ncbi:MAG: flagellar assembly protein FliX [Afipia sp.]|nr:flagellar assembly protein FliX [Afipia sp.]
MEQPIIRLRYGVLLAKDMPSGAIDQVVDLYWFFLFSRPKSRRRAVAFGHLLPQGGNSCRKVAPPAVKFNAALRPPVHFGATETRHICFGSGWGGAMKIGNTRATSQGGGTRGTAVRSAGSGFAPAGAGATRGAAGLSGLASLGAVDALLALQETGAADDALHAPRRKAVARAEELLDILDEIKLALLMGQVPKSKLSRLLSVVERQLGGIADPALREILDQIELRARVELAKFGTYAKI